MEGHCRRFEDGGIMYGVGWVEGFGMMRLVGWSDSVGGFFGVEGLCRQGDSGVEGLMRRGLVW